MENSRRRSRSPPYRRRRSRSLSPAPRGTLRDPRRDYSDRKRDSIPSSRDDYKGHRKTESSESYRSNNTRERRPDSGWQRRADARMLDKRSKPTDKIGSSNLSEQRSSHSRTSSIAVEEILSHSTGSSSTKEPHEEGDESQADRTPRPLATVPEVSHTSWNPTAHQTKSIQAKFNSELEFREVSIAEKATVNSIWDRRIRLTSHFASKLGH